MTIEKQNEFLLSLVTLLCSELCAHVAFQKWAKLLVEGEDVDVDGILAQCRRDPALQSHVDATLRDLSAKLYESAQSSPDQAFRQFLERWNPKGSVN